MFWSGDSIAWGNLFSHYIFCLHKVVMLALISERGTILTDDDIPVFDSVLELPTDNWKSTFQSINDTFFSNNKINLLISLLATRRYPIRRDELEIHLRTIHLFALKVVFDIFIEHGLCPESNRLSQGAEDALETICEETFNLRESALSMSNQIDESALLFSVINNASKQMELLADFKSDSVEKGIWYFLRNNFTASYIRRIEKLCFPDWYTACFMDDYKNSSVWGHYGDNHSGACLIFEALEEEPHLTIKLECLNGMSSNLGYRKGWSNFTFHSIKYEKEQVSTDFFRSLGSLNPITLRSMWYMNAQGDMSTISDVYVGEPKTWRKNYWEKFYEAITVKSKDWRYEKELRLIYTSSLFDLSVKENRLLKYDFSSLKGLIFGINTKQEDKLKILKVIAQKCKHNNCSDFKFYQAYFCYKDNCIKKLPLGLLTQPSESPDQT